MYRQGKVRPLQYCVSVLYTDSVASVNDVMGRSVVQVWSGVLGRMPKRGVLTSTPPPPQLTGNLFAIDLAAIDRGWSMVPAARLNSSDSGVGPVVPRRWAAMSALGPGNNRISPTSYVIVLPEQRGRKAIAFLPHP